MTRRRQRRLLPDAIASAWVREIHYQSPITAKAVRLFHQAARPIDAEIAAALAPSERLANGIIRLHVPIGETFRLYGIEPGQIDWLIDFDPKTGKWHPHSADVTHSGIASLAAHVWHVMGRSDAGPLKARWNLLASLGLALLCALEKGGRIE
jgi:hypothetical protein